MRVVSQLHNSDKTSNMADIEAIMKRYVIDMFVDSFNVVIFALS